MKTFTVFGVSTRNGSTKFRATNNANYKSVLTKDGHSDIKLIVTEPLTRIEGAKRCKANELFADDRSQHAIEVELIFDSSPSTASVQSAIQLSAKVETSEPKIRTQSQTRPKFEFLVLETRECDPRVISILNTRDENEYEPF